LLISGVETGRCGIDLGYSAINGFIWQRKLQRLGLDAVGVPR
jgi:hypothetical protein